MFLRLTLLLSILFFISCRDRKPKIEVNKATSEKEFSTLMPNLKIYIEDGISMHGFFEKNSNFTTDIAKLFSNFPQINKINFNLISGDDLNVKTITTDKFNLIKKIDNIDLEKRNFEGTDYPAMLDKVITESNDNTISVFVSDFIHATDKGLSNENAETQIFQMLNDKKAKTKNFSIAILKFSSIFDGYFSYVSDYNKIIKGPIKIDTIKPYYVWFFGDNDAIEKLNLNHRSLSDLNFKGFEDFSIYNEKRYDIIDNPINWTILQFTNSIGTFRPSRDSKTNEGILDIVDVKPERETDEFQICIGIDLSKIPVSDEYKLDTSNFKIVSNGFKIEQISQLNGNNFEFKGIPSKIDNKDLNVLSKVKPTHLLFLKSNLKIVDNIEISFKRKISPILIQSNSDDESKLKNLMTYGFRNFTKAIERSFPSYSDNSFYFTKKINVENKKGGVSWIGILIFLVVLVIIVFVVVKIKR